MTPAESPIIGQTIAELWCLSGEEQMEQAGLIVVDLKYYLKTREGSVFQLSRAEFDQTPCVQGEFDRPITPAFRVNRVLRGDEGKLMLLADDGRGLLFKHTMIVHGPPTFGWTFVLLSPRESREYMANKAGP